MDRAEGVRRRVDELAEEGRRQYEATAHAIQSFADILHVSTPTFR